MPPNTTGKIGCWTKDTSQPRLTGQLSGRGGFVVDGLDGALLDGEGCPEQLAQEKSPCTTRVSMTHLPVLSPTYHRAALNGPAGAIRGTGMAHDN